MPSIVATWASWGVDANHDGVKDPFNIFDAAAAAAEYLCAAGRDLTTTRGQVQAILSYNYSYNYVSMVMGLEAVYAKAPYSTHGTSPDTSNAQDAIYRNGGSKGMLALKRTSAGYTGAITMGVHV